VREGKEETEFEPAGCSQACTMYNQGGWQ